MAISARAVGAWAYAVSGSVTPTLPTHAAGDMLMVRLAYKSSAIATCAASIDTASYPGWVKLGEFHDGTTASGNGVGSVAVAHFWKIATSAAETSPNVTFSQTVTQVGHSAVSFQKATADAWLDPVGDGGGFATGAPISATIQSHVSVTAGDMVVFFLASRDDTAFTSPTITQTGITFDTVTEYPATAGLDGSGADGSYDAGYRLATAGTSSAAAVVTATIATETGSAWMTRLRVISGTRIFPTSTAATGVTTAALDLEAWTSRGSSAGSSYVDTVAGPTAPIQTGTAGGASGEDWFTRPLTAFTLGGAARVHVRARESNAANNASVGCEIARVASDGSSPAVWGSTTVADELTTVEKAYEFTVTAANLAVSTGQRLRVRFYFDDSAAAPMAAASFGAYIVMNGPTADASGDTWLTFTQTLTEGSAGPTTHEAAAAVTANGTITTAGGTAYRAVAATPSSLATVTAAGASIRQPAAATISAAATVTAAADIIVPGVTHEAAAAIAATATLAGDGQRVAGVAAAVSATATVSPAPVATRAGAASIVTAATVTGGATATLAAATAVTAQATVTAGATAARTVAAATSASATVSAAVVLRQEAASAVTALASVDANASIAGAAIVHNALAAVTATASVSAAAGALQSAAATAAAQATTSAEAGRYQQVAAVAGGLSAATAIAERELAAAIALQGTALAAGNLTGYLAAQAAIEGIASVIAVQIGAAISDEAVVGVSVRPGALASIAVRPRGGTVTVVPGPSAGLSHQPATGGVTVRPGPTAEVVA